MEGQHWVMLLVVFGVAYCIGARWPTFARQIGFA